MNQFEVDNFLHLNSLRLRRERWSTDDGKKLILTFINKASFQHTTTFFQIHTVEPMSPERILAENDLILKEKIANNSETDYSSIRVQQFKMRHSAHLVFVVKASFAMLAGSVCRPLPHLVDDFMDSPVI
ncbi:hypothetical protein GCK72_019985 [Caenorhabditis remanei]|nr:hypothetical protein GCK72_019985 [Caenorhabditis remanei]KAF1753428.1 hypothetical protein GCK72_019985 [Caenorhabditis remanei]